MSVLGRTGERWLRLVCGCILVVVGLSGTVQSVRAAAAQSLYRRTKNGFFAGTSAERPPLADAVTVLRNCEQAYRWYAPNYYFADLASIRALESALRATTAEDFQRFFGASEHWNRVSIALNPYNIDAMHVKCRLLREKGDMAGAIRFWRDVVLEREYWNPDHHETYVNLLLKAGETTKAIAAAQALKGGKLKRDLTQLGHRRARPAPEQ